MALIGQILYGIGALGMLVCFVLVLVQMFKHDQTGLAIACIVLLCCGVGAIVAFIFGWIKNKEWGITPIMLVWSVCWVLAIIGGVLSPNTFSGWAQIPK